MGAPPISLSHAGFHVFDMAAMVDFFTSVYGLAVSDRGRMEGRGEIVFLAADRADHHQLVLYEGRNAGAGAVHHNHVAFRVDSLARLRRIHAALEAWPEVTRVAPVTHGITWSVYAHDPEGNRTEAFVDTPWFVDQPFAEPFDISLDDAALHRFTEELIRGQPGFRPYEEWRAGFAAASPADLARPGFS